MTAVFIEASLTYAVLVTIRAVMGEMVQAISRHSVLSRQAEAAISKYVTVAHSAASVAVSL
jgi:hypothetical protein